MIAQLGVPDMKLPIQYALFYPDRRPMSEERLDFFKLKEITFEEPRIDVFKGLPLALKAAHIGGSMPTVFNAANEMAVRLFLGRKLRFLEIYDMITDAMEHHSAIANPNLDEILGAEKETYEYLKSLDF